MNKMFKVEGKKYDENKTIDTAGGFNIVCSNRREAEKAARLNRCFDVKVTEGPAVIYCVSARGKDWLVDHDFYESKGNAEKAAYALYQKVKEDVGQNCKKRFSYGGFNTGSVAWYDENNQKVVGVNMTFIRLSD